MKKKRGFLGFAFCLTLVASYFLFVFLAYDKSSAMHPLFPIPKQAELVHIYEEKGIKEYQWIGVYETDGIPLSYRVSLLLHGWKNVNSVGTTEVYEKANTKILLNLQTDYLSLGRIRQ